jgi:predicted phosphoribosyltransferase
MLVTVKILRKAQPAKIIIAVPVASDSAMAKLAPEVDELVVLLVPEEFYGVGRFYQDFRQVSDEEVMDYLEQAQEDLS